MSDSATCSNPRELKYLLDINGKANAEVRLPSHVDIVPSRVVFTRMNCVVSGDFRFLVNGGAAMSDEFLVVGFWSKLKREQGVCAVGVTTARTQNFRSAVCKTRYNMGRAGSQAVSHFS